MRILWLCHFLPYPPTGHGALQRTHQLLVRTADTHDIGVIAFARADAVGTRGLIDDARRYLEPRLRFLDVVEKSDGRLRHRRIAALAAAALGSRSFWENSFWTPDMLDRLEHRMRDFQPDVVHFDTIYLARYLRGVSGRPIVLTHHNIESALLAQRASIGSAPLRWFFKHESKKTARLERQIAPHIAMNIMVSDPDAAVLRQEAPGARTAVVPNGVDTEYFHPDANARPRPLSLIFVGGMDWYPNRLAMEWFATKLWPSLASDRAERNVTIVGRNPPSALVDAAKADQRITVTGFVDDVRPYMNQASIYICPIHVGGGTRLKILDALAMQRPLVSTQLGVGGLGLTEGVHYLGAETVDDFIRQIRRLETEPSLGGRLASAGREFVLERYAWPSVSRALSDCFESALAEPAQASNT